MSDLFDLTNVYFYYTRIAEPYKDKFAAENDFPKYTTTLVVDKAQYDQFVKAFPKKRKFPISNEDFVQKYKTPVPFPEQSEQYVIKLGQKAFKNNGEPMPDSLRPKVYQFINGVQTDITSTLIGNGSKGTVRYSVWVPNEQVGPTPNLHSALITELVSYERKDPNSFAPPSQ